MALGDLLARAVDATCLIACAGCFLAEGGHVAEARVRPIDGIGVELRYEATHQLARVSTGR